MIDSLSLVMLMVISNVLYALPQSLSIGAALGLGFLVLTTTLGMAWPFVKETYSSAKGWISEQKRFSHSEIPFVQDVEMKQTIASPSRSSLLGEPLLSPLGDDDL